MNGRVFYQNIASQATLTVTSEATDYPKANLVDRNQATPHRSTAITEQIYKFEFPAAVNIRGFSVLGHNIVSGDTTWKIQANSADSWESPAYTHNLDKSAPSIEALNQTYKWWRLVAQKASGTYIEIKEICFFQADYTFENNYEWEYEAWPEVMHEGKTGTGGQIFKATSPLYERLVYSGSFSGFSDSQKSVFLAINRCDFVMFMPDGIAGPAYFGDIRFSGGKHVGPQNWTCGMTFIESPAGSN